MLLLRLRYSEGGRGFWDGDWIVEVGLSDDFREGDGLVALYWGFWFGYRHSLGLHDWIQVTHLELS